jgi:carbamate kinase
VEAVVNKDLTAAELAITLNADRLLVLTDVPAVIRGYGTPDARPIPAIDTVALSAMTFPAGSMDPRSKRTSALSGRQVSRPRSAR